MNATVAANKCLKIGEVATASGLSIKNLRYYQRTLLSWQNIPTHEKIAQTICPNIQANL